MNNMPSISLAEYSVLHSEEKEKYCEVRYKEMIGPLVYKKIDASEYQLPVFEHEDSGIEFVLIPSNTCSIGLSEENELAAKAISNPPQYTKEELTPVLNIGIKEFLLSKHPITQKQFNLLSSSKLENQIFMGDNMPEYVSREQLECFRSKLSLRFRLPSEYEWECACKAASEELFPWGNSLLTDNLLDGWVNPYLDESKVQENKFGFGKLFCGEFCDDLYRPSHDSLDCLENVYVIKGGASLFWPWQDQEWVWCTPPMRMPSSDTMDGRACFRLALNYNDLFGS